MSVSAISGGASALSKLASTKTAKPAPKPEPKTDADGDHDGTTAAEATEKSGKIDVKG
jgi:hypothetical protein